MQEVQVKRAGRVLAGLVLALLLGVSPAAAVNWLMLQGAEPADADWLRLGGFVQLEYHNAGGGRLPAGPFAGQPLAAGQVGPLQRSSVATELRKLQLAARGRLHPSLNYSLKTISGDNGASRIDGGNRLRLIEASLTWRSPLGPYLRLGLFKPPGAEEISGFSPPNQYVNLTNGANLLLQERFFREDGSDPQFANEPGICGCCRDLGLLLFDAQRLADWEWSYGAALTQGYGLRLNDPNDHPDLYLYLALERLWGERKGMQRLGWKLFSWWQEGRRDLTDGLTGRTQDYRRCRFGGGTALQTDRLRLVAEIIKAKGMIEFGTDGSALAGSRSNDGRWVASYNLLPRDQALAWSLDAGWRLWRGLWLDGRYDRLDLATEITGERELRTWTAGLSWRMPSGLQLKCNYEWRDGRAPHQPRQSAVNQILAELPNRLSCQLLYQF